MGENAWAVSEEVCLRIDDSPAPRGYISAFLVDKPDSLFFFNRDFMRQYHQAPANRKSSVPGHGYFAKLESFEQNHCEQGELYMEYRKKACQEKNGELCDFCKENDFVYSSEAKPTPQPYPDYKRLPDFHYLPITQTPMDGRKPDDYQPRAQIKRMFEEGNLKAGEIEAIEKFSKHYIVSEKLVADYVEHLSQIEMRKEKRKAESVRQRTQRQQQEYNDIDWDHLYNSDSLSTLRVYELDLYLNHHKMPCRGKKKETIAMVKAHIGSQILAALAQDKQASATSTSDSDSDIIDRIVASGISSSGSESSGSNDSTEGPQETTESPPHSTSRYGRKRTRVLQDNYISWEHIDRHVTANNKTQPNIL